MCGITFSCGWLRLCFVYHATKWSSFGGLCKCLQCVFDGCCFKKGPDAVLDWAPVLVPILGVPLLFCLEKGPKIGARIGTPN